MRHQKSFLRLLIALAALVVLSLSLPAHVDVAADGGQVTSADKDKRRGPPDPCEKAPKRSETADRNDTEQDDDGDDHADDDDRGDGRNKRLRDCEPPASGGVAKGDFNGDGFADLAVGVPFEDEDFVGSVGAVNIIYGSATGLTSTGDQYLTELTFGFPYTTDDRFGAALASGDFNGDSFSDLAIGMPNREAFGQQDHGVVLLIDGSANGLVTSTARRLSLVGNHGGRAGAALVWADFNGDGFGDLAVGIPDAFQFGFPFLPLFNAGEVQVFYGGPNGLSGVGAQVVFEGFEDGMHFGAPLAAGDFNADGAADLAIGIPLDTVSRSADAGSLLLVPGGVNGLRPNDHQFLHQNIPDVADTAERGDQFGFALAVGDFNADLRDDLAVGVPGEDLLSDTVADAGAVQVFFGSFQDDELVDAANDIFFGQGSLAGVAIEAGDAMGRALAVGKFNNDFFADLAVGVPGEDIGSIRDAGLVTVLYGGLNGPSLTNIQHWHQNVAGIDDSAEAGDQFGRALSAWNYGKSTHSDLAIGVPFEDLLSVITGTQQADAGAVHVIYGSSTGLTATGSQFWHQDRAGISSASSAGDRFGVTLY
jgi:hypothetical protein